jgi:Domain of unknown function (DUF1707)/Cell wall-active antibiotics response 4TMS YvqF
VVGPAPGRGPGGTGPAPGCGPGRNGQPAPGHAPRCGPGRNRASHDLSRLVIVGRVDESQLHKRDQQPAQTPRPVPNRPVTEGEIRASDADRERVADILRDAFAEGRLTPEEHAERIEAVYASKTLGELAPLTRDLPVPVRERPAPAAAPRPEYHVPARVESPTMAAVFGGVTRKGRWRVGGQVTALAFFGGVEIDLTEAVFESPEVVIQVTAIFGGVDIKVPENATVRAGGGVGIFGGFDVKGYESMEPGAPVINVRGLALFGGVDVKRKKGKRLREWARRQLDG